MRIEQLSTNPEKQVLVNPPSSAQFNEIEFAQWYQEVAGRLIVIGLAHTVTMTPILTEEKRPRLLLLIDTPNKEIALRIKAAVLN